MPTLPLASPLAPPHPIFLTLPGILLTALILFLDAIALGHFLLLPSTGGTRAEPTTSKRAKGPFHPDPQQARPPFLGYDSQQHQTAPGQPARPRECPKQGVGLEERAQLLEKNKYHLLIPL